MISLSRARQRNRNTTTGCNHHDDRSLAEFSARADRAAPCRRGERENSRAA